MKNAHKIRTGFIFLFFCSAYVIILCNLYSIQIRQRNFFINLGKQQYRVTIKNMPERAGIYDRNGQPLALNRTMLSAFIMPKKIEHTESLEHFLKKHFPHALERWYHHQDAQFLYIKRKLTPDQLLLIEHSNVSDIKLLKEPHRFYPVESAGHLVGITDIDNNGQIGIELLYNQQLAGTQSSCALEKDARSGHFYFTKIMHTAGTDGIPITLTLDADLQFLTYENLKETVEQYQAQEGAALIMNPDSGEIIAMAQFPSFDPHDTENIVIEHTKNKCLTDVHELGSVMKVFVALAALQEGVVTSDELIDCENTKTTFLHGIRVNTVYPRGIISFSEVLECSNNIGIVKVAQRLGPTLYDHYKRLGFGSKTGLNWPGEQSGFVNHPQQWSKRSLISLSFGYEITANLVQLARAFSVIANGGYLVKPILVLSDKTNTIEPQEKLYNQETIDAMREILEKVVTRGTARRAALKGYRVMGKTGSANMVINGFYDPQHSRYSCAGIIEKGSYRRVIVVFIKDTKQSNVYASQVAAPLFERIAEQTIIHDSVI